MTSPHFSGASLTAAAQTAKQTPIAATPEWAHAMELLLQQIVFVLDVEGRDSFTTRKVARWNNQCIHEMLRTGSVPMPVIEELQRVVVRVLT